MATFSKTWVQGPNQITFASAVDQEAQYRQVGFALMTDLISAGWTVERSSDSITAGAGQNIGTAAEIIHAAAASVHSWVLLRAPTGKGSPIGTGFGMTLDFSAAVGVTPRAVAVILGWGATLTNGTTSVCATLTTPATVATFNIIPWTGAVNGSFCVWYADDGDLILGVKTAGSAFFSALFAVRDDAVDARGNFTLSLHFITSAGVDVVTWTQLQAVGNWRSFLADGTAASTPIVARSVAADLTSWTNGLEASSSSNYWRDVELLANAATTGARDLGLWVDILGCPTGTIFNLVDDNDDGNAAPFEWRSVGDILIPCDSAITV